MRPSHFILLLFLLFSCFSTAYAQNSRKVKGKELKSIPLPADTTGLSTQYGTMTVRKQQEEQYSKGDYINIPITSVSGSGRRNKDKKRKRKFPWIFQKRNVTTNNDPE